MAQFAGTIRRIITELCQQNGGHFCFRAIYLKNIRRNCAIYLPVVCCFAVFSAFNTFNIQKVASFQYKCGMRRTLWRPQLQNRSISLQLHRAKRTLVTKTTHARNIIVVVQLPSLVTLLPNKLRCSTFCSAGFGQEEPPNTKPRLQFFHSPSRDKTLLQ